MDSKPVVIAGTNRASFGLTKGGDFVTGYLTKDMIEQLEFEELISGAVWLLRNGSINVLESIAVEGMKNSSGFVVEKAPRTAIGHDEAGRYFVTHSLFVHRAGCS